MTLTTLEDVFIKMSMDYNADVFGTSVYNDDTKCNIQNDESSTEEARSGKEQRITIETSNNDNVHCLTRSLTHSKNNIFLLLYRMKDHPHQS